MIIESPNNQIANSNLKLLVMQCLLVCGVILFHSQHKVLILSVYLVISAFYILNTRYLLYVFYSSIWISFKLHFEISGVIIRLSDIIFLLIFISWLINSFYSKNLMLIIPKKNDYVIMALLFLCAFSLLTSQNRIGTLIESIQIIQLVFFYYMVKSIIKDKLDIKYFMIITIIFGIIDSFWVFNSVSVSGIGERYIGILQIIPDELPYAIIFLYIFFLSEKNIFIKSVKFLFILILLLSLVLTMGRGLLIITLIMFFSATFIHFISMKKYLGLILVSITSLIISTTIISSIQLASERYGSIITGGENANMRLYNWYSSVSIIKDYPFTGVGLGNDTDYLKSNLPQFSPEIVQKFGGDTPHNEFFHFGIQVGILGMLFVIFFYSNLIVKSFRILKRSKFKSKFLPNALFAISLGISVWSIANDVLLAGNGYFAILIMAFIDKIYNNYSIINLDNR